MTDEGMVLPTRNFHALIPGIFTIIGLPYFIIHYLFVTFHGIKDSADMIQVLDLERRR